MATDHRAALRQIRRFPELVEYLRDELGWPFETEDFEELTFEYTPEELGLKDEDAVKVRTIHQLRQLQPGQPWGIFFVEFERKRLPVVVLRRILSHLVIKKRASANKAQRPAWHLHDLLFVSAFGPESSDQREIAFAHFHQEDGDLPTLRVLGWDGADTGLKLDYVADVLHQRLGWPDNADDVGAWRSQWSGAFRHRLGHIIRTADALAERLAELARGIRDAARTMLAHESEKGPLTRLYKAFQIALIHDLTEADFADTYAQTITYGLLTAAISRTEMTEGRDGTALLADNVTDMVPITNPFLREMLGTFLKAGGRNGGIDFDELRIQEVVELLRGNETDLPAVLRDFGNRAPGEDPVIHFYEHFLDAYDRHLKVNRGVFYTPLPVVSYIVHSVHELLQTEFGLPDGLASIATWGEIARRITTLKIPDDTPPESPFVMVLDPAAGTGTFLVEVIDIIHRTLSAKWDSQGLGAAEQQAAWNEYVPRHLLPRLHGYELMMAPYAIAHMKLPLKLKETGFDGWTDLSQSDRVHVYLTNSLEPPSADQQVLQGILPALAHEAQAVANIKKTRRFTVVIANPPYSNYSANLSAEARAVVDKYRSFAGVLIRERNQLQFERNLQDDFVKFLAIGEQELQNSKAGILGYITNATMLASISLRGMREHLMQEFSALHEMHLHGGTNETSDNAHNDQNIFEIAQAVSIHIYLKNPDARQHAVRFSELWGPRPSKYAFLSTHTVYNTDWVPVAPDKENCAFLPQDKESTYLSIRLNNVFATFGAGVKTNRDAVAIGMSKGELIHSLDAFSTQFSSQMQFDQKYIRPIIYRPFDLRLIYYHEDVVASRSYPTMQHMLAGDNIGLVASSTWTTPDRFSVSVSSSIVEMKTGTHDRGTTCFPLFRYESILDGGKKKIVNLKPEFCRQWERSTGMQLAAEDRGDLIQTAGPMDVFAWIYGLCYSREYRRRHRALLAQGFPIVLFPCGPELLRKMVQFGGRLVELHLLRGGVVDHGVSFIGSQDMRVEKVSFSNNTVWIDKNQSSGFRGVADEVWDTYVGGYRVCEKWLKDRKGRTLSDEEITHYQKIVMALAETIRIMGEIDEVIDQQGGWPAAFVTEAVAVPPVAAEGLPDLGSIAAEAWATPPGLTQENIALFAIIDVLRQFGGSAQAEQVRLAAMLVRSPALARPFMDAATREEWARVVGREAEPLADNVIPLRRYQQDQDGAWRAAVAQLQGSGAIVVDAGSGTWSAGASLPQSSGQAWAEGRATVAAALLADIEIAQAGQTLATFAQDVEHGRTGTAVS